MFDLHLRVLAISDPYPSVYTSEQFKPSIYCYSNLLGYITLVSRYKGNVAYCKRK